jgi:glycosyltransferase involved in cell wall biosynthesis
MSRPLVSVVIIFFNAEEFLGQAIDSVLAQSFESWELLLVDDGSRDHSGEVARSYAQRLPGRVSCLHHSGHENRGMSASRNLGVRRARGKYLAFLDADDVFLPDKLRRQVALLESHPGVAMVYGRTEYWYGWTGDPADRELDRIQEHGIPGDVEVEPPSLVTSFLSGKAAVPSLCGVLVRRGAVESVGGFEESFRGLYEDQILYAKIGLEHRVFVSDECLDRYRQHAASICATTAGSERALQSRRRYLEWLRDYQAGRQVESEELRRTLEREIWLTVRPGIVPHRLHGRIRWVKKWMLKIEERLLPIGLRRRLWTRRAGVGPARSNARIR